MTTATNRPGYTLIELLVVIAIVAGLAGLGLGFLQHGGNDLDQAAAQTRDMARIAHSQAQFYRAPAQLIVERWAPPDQAGLATQADEQVRLRVVALLLASEWNFDGGSARGARGVSGELFGARIGPGGRVGNALHPNREGGSPGVRVPLRELLSHDLRRGLVLRLQLRLENRSPCVAVRIGTQLEVGVDGSGRPQAMVTLALTEDKPGRVIRLSGKHRVRLNQWFELELAVDSRRATLLLNGIAQDLQPVRDRELYLDRRAHLEISDGGQPVIGRVDEVRVFSYETIAEELLPPSVDFGGGPTVLHFDPLGMLDPALHGQLPVLRLRRAGVEEAIHFDRGGLPK